MDLRYTQWIMLAVRESFCKETSNKINVGDKMLYLPPIPKLGIPGRSFCEKSKEYKRCENHIDTGWKL